MREAEWCTLISLCSPQQRQINRSVKGSCAAGGWLTWLAPKELQTHTHTHIHTRLYFAVFTCVNIHWCIRDTVCSKMSMTAVQENMYRPKCMMHQYNFKQSRYIFCFFFSFFPSRQETMDCKTKEPFFSYSFNHFVTPYLGNRWEGSKKKKPIRYRNRRKTIFYHCFLFRILPFYSSHHLPLP